MPAPCAGIFSHANYSPFDGRYRADGGSIHATCTPDCRPIRKAPAQPNATPPASDGARPNQFTTRGPCASAAEVQEAHEPHLVAFIVPVQAPLVVLVGRVLLCDPIGPVVQFGQPILAQRGDLVAGEEMHSDAATVESTNSEARRRSVVGIGSTGELTTAIARFAVRATLRAVANIGPQARIGIMMTDS